ncbi:MAG TPA: zinc ribbon domain-containing protein [Polyangiaceae bacterium]|jgi:hypothetical protein|nr:zinc ribbon domain-containing protein [Polyangiaceae bacterium]
MSACGRCATPLEEGDLRCVICGFVAPERARAHATGDAARIVRCVECGAAVAYRAEKRAPLCMFCGATTRVEEPTDPLEVASLYLPFSVAKETAAEAMRAHLRSLGWFHPPDLAASATVDSVTPVWFAAWIFDARADVAWAADSDAGSRRSAWAPHAGRTHLDWKNVLVSASRGLTLKEVATLARGYDLSKAEPIPPDVADDVERFDVERSAARAKVLAAAYDLASAELQSGHIPGSSFRNVKVSALLDGLVTRRFALPAYVFVYRYDDRPYRAVVHGRHASIVMGDAPLSWTRIALVVVGGIALVAAIVAIVAAATR